MKIFATETFFIYECFTTPFQVDIPNELIHFNPLSTNGTYKYH